MHPYVVAPSTGGSTSSPTITSPPQVLTPAYSSVNKPLAPMPGGSNLPQISINKDWVLPPKPKPGRKPAIDTPPTKRKAQNREAQRAFRERRAAKVSELQEEMKKLQEEGEREQKDSRKRIKQLESNVEEYSHAVSTWRRRYRNMEMECAKERQGRQNAEMEIEVLKKRMVGGTEAVPLPPRRSTRSEQMGDQASKGDLDNTPLEEVSLTCGKCSSDTRCQCIEEAFEMSGLSTDDPTSSTFKRPYSPPSNLDNSKRARQESNFDNASEIDFTAQYASHPPLTLTTPASTSSIPAKAPPDPCGFCETGGTCICAELSKEKMQYEDTKPPISLLCTTNQASANGATNADPCVNGPGTCAQCLSNPTSTLFCKAVAVNRDTATDDSTQTNDAPKSVFIETDGVTGPVLTCADAFTTLSRHPGFDQATSELSTWVPQLTAIKRPASRSDRTPYDIEAASVMSVLKFFDRRFGSPAGYAKVVKKGEPSHTDSRDSKCDQVTSGSFIAY